jgi:hypothetical protein
MVKFAPELVAEGRNWANGGGGVEENTWSPRQYSEEVLQFAEGAAPRVSAASSRAAAAAAAASVALFASVLKVNAVSRRCLLVAAAAMWANVVSLPDAVALES